MKRLNSIIFTIFFTAMSFGQNSIETNQLHIKNLIVESFDEIWSELNSKNIEKYYTKDFLLLEDGEVWSNKTISNYLDNALEKPIPNRVNSFEFIEVKVANDRAWIAYKNQATFSLDNKIVRTAHWLESAAAILTENGWKLEMLHSTRIKNE
ncbi:MAG: DUF4440 domain-containing protein [Eudoraea sp.]